MREPQRGLLSPPYFFINQKQLRLCPEPDLERRVQSLELGVRGGSSCGEVEGFKNECPGLLNDSVKFLALSFIREL